MKTVTWGIIGGVIGSIIVGSIFFVGSIEFLDTKQDLERTNYKCVQTFDNIIIPIILGQVSPSEKNSNAWKNFHIEECATNHSQWESLSSNQNYIQMVGWDSFIQNEQEVLAQHKEKQKLEDMTTDVLSKNLFSSYKINTECELILIWFKDANFVKFTFNEIQSEEFKTKYPDEIHTIKKYNDLYQSITTETRDASDAFKEFPPEVLDSIFEIMSKELSINPQLKSFVKTIFYGELKGDLVNQIISNDKTKCGSTLQEFMESYKLN